MMNALIAVVATTIAACVSAGNMIFEQMEQDLVNTPMAKGVDGMP